MVVCNLCQKDVRNFVQSHIIATSIHHLSARSNFPHKAEILSGQVGVYSRKSRTGIYDDIVCDDCERKFNEWDEYALKFFKKAYDLSYTQSQQVIKYNGYNYKKLKLFFISLLWRAHMCKHSFYRYVNVAPIHQALLAKMILEKDPGGWQDYAVSLERYNSERPAASIIVTPVRAQDVGGVNFYTFHIAGFKVHIKCDQRYLSASQELHFLNEAGSTLIPLIPYEGSKLHQEGIKVCNLQNNKKFDELATKLLQSTMVAG